MTHVCHYCEKEGAEYTCPECDEWTCEDCFTPMTQWNAGDALPCLGCSNESERQRSEECSREVREKEQRESMNAQARAKYHSPEARAKRENTKRLQAEKRVEQERKLLESVADVMKGFSRFF